MAFQSDSGVAIVELRRPPNNFLDVFAVRALASAMEELDADPNCRCIILATEGKHFCAGRDFSGKRDPEDTSAAVYQEAVRLMRLDTPMIAAVQGGAIGAGLGLALTADFRFCSDRAYFSANFVTHGLHHGFGLSVTLPQTIGFQAATDMLYTGRRVGAVEAKAMNLVKDVVAEMELRAACLSFASILAQSQPAAIRAIRQTMRGNIADRFAEAVTHEASEQKALRPGA